MDLFDKYQKKMNEASKANRKVSVPANINVPDLVEKLAKLSEEETAAFSELYAGFIINDGHDREAAAYLAYCELGKV